MPRPWEWVPLEPLSQRDAVLSRQVRDPPSSGPTGPATENQADVDPEVERR